MNMTGQPRAYIHNDWPSRDYDIKNYCSVKESDHDHLLVYAVYPMWEESITQKTQNLNLNSSTVMKPFIKISLNEDAKVSDLISECGKLWHVNVCDIIAVCI